MTAAGAIAAVALIVAGCELFTNAVEWAGHRLGLAQGAVGSLLAAIGTALPETIVPVVALATRSPSADEVARGAVIGAPFLLLTVVMAATGLAVLSRRGRRSLSLDPAHVRRDLGVFLAAFAADTVAMGLPAPARVPLGVGLLAGYTAYAWATLRSGEPAEELPEPLHLLRPFAVERPPSSVIAVQLALAAAMLVGGSELFVGVLTAVATALHADPLILSLILVPVVTELPEALTSLVWVRSGDDGLAFGTVAGAAVFQACVLGFIGVTFTTWRPTPGGLASALPTLVMAAALLAVLWRGRAGGGLIGAAALPWLGYVVLVMAAGSRLQA